MFALLLVWDFSGKPSQLFEQLRRYIAGESWARYAGRQDLRYKVWFSNPATGQWGAFYLWDTREALEEEVRTMRRVEAMTGVAPAIHRFEVEAIQEGRHSGQDLLRAGLAWASNMDRFRAPFDMRLP